MTSAEFRSRNPDFAHTNDPTIVIKEIAPGVRLFMDRSDHVFGLTILRGQYWQDEVRFVRRVVGECDSTIDVGCRIGFFTMQMAAMVGPAGRVYAFEPLDANADLFERSIAENRFDDRVLFHRAAAGATSGTATLTFPSVTLNSGGAYLLREGSAPLAGNQSKNVPLVALDALEIRRPVRFIKIDVEGAEPQVIRGASRLVKDDRPVILSELHPTQLERASGMTADQFLAEMHALGYRAHSLRGDRRGGPTEAGPYAGPYEKLLGPVLERGPVDTIISVALIPGP